MDSEQSSSRGVSGLPRSHVPTQFFWYVLVGGLSFVADLAVFVGLLRLGIHVAAALVAGFVIGTLVNYFLSLMLAFSGGRHQRHEEILRLFAVALVGLGLTAVLVWALLVLGLPPFTAKVLATPPVLFWNYGARRFFVFWPEMPAGIWRLSSRLMLRGKARRKRSDHD